MNIKELCSCGATAQWVYMSGYSSGCSPYSCDDCISSPEDQGCSCNWNNVNDNREFSEGKDTSDNLPEGIEGKDWRWIIDETNFDKPITKESGYWISLDEKGRPYPCCEYEYSEIGFYTEEYQNYLEGECKRIGYNILSDPEEQKWFEEFKHIVWTDKLIEKIEKIIKEYNDKDVTEIVRGHKISEYKIESGITNNSKWFDYKDAIYIEDVDLNNGEK